MAATRDEIAKLYVATFDRAADADGLAYWISDGTDATTDLTNLEDLASAMTTSDEYKALYDGLDREGIVTAMYNNLFDRAPDASGLDYWVNGGGATVPVDELIIALINGAQGDDAAIMENKAEVGLAYADAGLNDVDAAKTALDGVTADADTVTAAEAAVADLANVKAYDAALASYNDAATAYDTAHATATDSITAAQTAAQTVDTVDLATAAQTAAQTAADAADAELAAATTLSTAAAALKAAAAQTATTEDDAVAAADAKVATDHIVTAANDATTASTLVDNAEAALTAAQTAAAAEAADVAAYDAALVSYNDAATAYDTAHATAADSATAAQTAAQTVDTLELANAAKTAAQTAVTDATAEKTAADNLVVAATALVDAAAKTDVTTDDAVAATDAAAAQTDVTTAQADLDAANQLVTDADAAVLAVTPVSYEIVADANSVVEGNSVTFTVTANKALDTDAAINYQIKGVEAGGGTADPLTDLGIVNGTLTIKAGETTGTITLTPADDGVTEGYEGFAVSLLDSSFNATSTSAAVVIEDAPNAGQSFTLTTGVDSATDFTGGAGNDTFTAVVNAVGTDSTWTSLDDIDGGAGDDTLVINKIDDGSVTSNIDLTIGTISNIETIDLKAAGFVKLDTTTVSGLKTLNSIKSNTVVLTASDTTDVNVSGTAGLVKVDGGKDIAVTDDTAARSIIIGGTTAPTGTITVTDNDNSGANAIEIHGGTDVTVAATADTAMGSNITIGAATAATGAVVVTQNLNDDGAGADSSGHNIYIIGGSTINVTENLTSTAKTSTSNGALQAADIRAFADDNTTDVTATQNSNITTVTKDATAQTQESASVKFADLKDGDAITIEGLTFTASKDLTAAQVAASFASLSDGDTQSSGGDVTNGTFTGSISGWTSGSADSSTVVFTSTAADDGQAAGTAGGVEANVANLTTTITDNGGGSTNASVTTTDGVDGIAAVTSANSIVDGDVIIDDNATASIKTVTIDGFKDAYLGTSTSLDALTSLSLAHSSGTGVALNTTQTSLDLTVDDVNLGTVMTLDNGGANINTLNITTKGGDSAFNLVAAALTNLSIDAGAALDLSTSGNANLGNATVESVTITGAASVNLGTALSDDKTLNTFDASANTGGVTATVETDAATLTGDISEYKFSAGDDSVTAQATTGTLLGTSITTGEGNDTVSLFSGITGFADGKTIDAGNGTDTLSMDAADLSSVTTTNTFQDGISGFEKVTVGAVASVDAAVNATLDLANLDNISYVNVSGIVADNNSDASDATEGASLAISNLAADGTVNITSAILDSTSDSTSTASLDVALADATGSDDVLNLAMTSDAGISNTGEIYANDIETINITATDVFVDANNDGKDDSVANDLFKLSADSAATINISGDANFDFILTDSAATLIDATALTGDLFADANNDSETLLGGSGNDNLTATGSQDTLNGGAGDDTLTGADLTTLTGGEGHDTFVMNTPSSVNSYSTITDFSSGDIIDLGSSGTVAFNAAGVTLADTAVFQDYANAAVNALGADGDDATWFQYDGNTYIVQSGNTTANDDFQNGSDSIIQITGLVDLGADASYNMDQGTLESA